LSARRSGIAPWAALGAAWAATGLTRAAAAAEPPPVPALSDSAAEEVVPAAEEVAAIEEPATGASPQVSPLVITGYVDVGFAKAQGDGTSYPTSYATSPPSGSPDYYVDTFAPAVNSRGDVASTVPPMGTTPNGFLPHSAGIGGTSSFLLNTADVDVRYTATEVPVLVFTRLQLVPRLYGPLVGPGEGAGESTRLVLEQAFGRITPLRNAELAISVGKFDSVFGIEYLDNQANFRIGVTPSLIARYTTGQSVGVKAFYRAQIIPASSAVSLNVAATNSGTFVDSLQAPARSLTGVPVATARLGYELNLERISFKLGASASYGPRNDQADGSSRKQTLLGADARLVVPTLTVAAEFVHVNEQDADGPKVTGLGVFGPAAEFYAHGFYVQAAEELPLRIAPFRQIGRASCRERV